MSKRIFLNIFIFISFLFCKSVVFGQKIADFNPGSHCFYTESENYTNFFCYLGSAEASDKNPYSLARIKRLKKKGESYKLEALAPEKIKLNGQPGQTNPLNGAKISLLNLVSRYPVVIKAGDNKIYFMASISEDPKVESALYSSKEVNDSDKKPCSKILSMTVMHNPSILGNCIFLAVKNNKGEVFGSQGSGIATAFFNDENIDIEEKNVKTGKTDKKSTKIIDLRLYNAEVKDNPDLEEKGIDHSEDEKKKQKENKKLDEKKPKGPMIPKADNKAVSVNGSIDAVKISNDATIMSDIVDMHWDKELNTLYVAVTVKSGDAPYSGARAVLRGQISQDNIQAKKLKLLPIALDHVFKGSNKIVGTGESNQEVSIQKVRTMHTSTLLDYLIVVGGNGNESTVGNKVYALPLVNNQKEINLLHDIKDVKEKTKVDTLRKALLSKHGSLAKYNQVPKDYYNNEFFLTRSFVQEANYCDDLVSNSESSAMVGSEDLPLNPNEKISDIFIVSDSVFVTIANDYNGITTPGIFHSQAIFDDKGRVASWTKWLRVAGVDKPFLCAGLDVSIGAFWYVSKESANTPTVNVTKWLKDEDQVASLLNSQFATKQGGVQGFFDFSKGNPGFNNFSMMIATGFKKIALIETGSSKNGVYRANKDVSKNVILFDDKSLEPLGPIVAADVANNIITHDNWIFVGGVGGIAVLCDKNGIGWKNKISGLGDIQGGLSFKKVGDYAFVKKIQSDGKFLYVMTGKRLDKIELSAESFKSGKLNVVKLADSLAQQGTVFNDFAVSDKFALLATSKGLYRVGNGRNIVTAKNSEQVSWTLVKVPEAVDIVARLFLISPTSNDLDYAKKGQVYVLSAYRGTNQTRLNRMFVNLENEITDFTIMPVNDLFIKNQLSSFFEFNSFREKFWTNGSLLMSICSTDLNSDLSLNILSPRVVCSAKSVMIRNYLVDLEIEKIYQMGNVVRNSASGALMINGSFGLRVNA